MTLLFKAGVVDAHFAAMPSYLLAIFKVVELDSRRDRETRKPALHVMRTEPAPSTKMDTPCREYATEDEAERLVRAASLTAART
jgi:hypothetical protein